MKVLIALIVIAAIGYFVLAFIRKKPLEEGRGTLPVFYGKRPLTEIEQTLFHRLTTALPECIVLAQVQVSQIVGIKKGPAWQTWFNKISRKSVDYLVCLKDFTIVAAIELDDSSHQREDRTKSDSDKDTALLGAGHKVIRWPAKELPDIDAIRMTFLGEPETEPQAKS